MSIAQGQSKPAPRERKTARAVPKASARRGRYALWVILFLIVAIVSVAFVANPLALLQSEATSDRPSESAATEASRTGTVIFEAAPHQCKHVTFDNDNGQTTESAAPCDDEVVFDAQGRPIPTGTKHTLNAISKSFSHGQ